ncbi:DUF6350 family protein [Streptacidiphilus sp. P02-A3a]|uniref:cell division protein PerM n=1 Tax=Streptacidiphilus sp. P02-A3a TaxID=2704468 RepID=UPI0015F7C2AF|nr:DUF6350 family protein [Streptacidiphilus sp. P02-A3a]QMU72654.1 hypothetical protein GXP74_34830 [Streptacidiphilus sp. P02-A3a]
MAFSVQRWRPTAAAGVCGPALRAGLLGGAAAAGAVLVAVALPVFFLWIVSPYVESGSGGVLHLAACLWLLAHGATLRFGAVPVGVPPLLLTSLALTLLYRTASRAARQAGAEQPGTLLTGLCAGYLLVGGVVTALAVATGGAPTVGPVAALGRLLLVALPTAAVGVRAGTGSWRFVPLPRYQPPSWARPSVRWGRRMVDRSRVPGGGAAVLRAGAGAGAALLGGGALAFAVSLLLRFGAAGTVSAQLAPDLVGRFSLLLLCATLLPNAAIWAAAYALGPGFALGGGFTPLATAATQPPAFPLLAALPGPGRSPLGLLPLAVPVVAGVVAAVLLGRAAGEWGVLATVRAGVAAAGCAGVLAAVCAGAAGGTLGVSALAGVGPSPWWTGLAALVWTLAVAVPGALLVRWRRAADRPAPEAPPRRLSRRASPATAVAWATRWWRRCCRRPE